MDDGKRDQYKHLKEVLESFDTTGVGSLCPEELSDLCRALHLEDATPTLLHALLQNQDRLTSRADFDQVKNALYLVLSTTVAAPPSSQETRAQPQPQPQPDSSVQPKFMCGSKRYGRRSKPEFIEPIADCSEVSSGQDPEYHEDSTVLRKRERWNVDESSTDEYEADGQLHPWNPDDPSTPRVSIVPLSDRLEDKLRQACEELAMPWDGCASHHELLALRDHLGLEVTEDVLQVLNGDEIMSVEAFASWVLNHTKPPTPFASTPYRRLKRLHSSQLFDETGRRTRCMTSTIRMCLFSTLDDGTGSTPAEDVLDAWMEEGIENSPAILQALNFDLKGKVNLGNLTVALEEEFLKNKNGILQAALASFKAEIRYLLELVDRECREKEKIRSDLEKAEKLKTQLATEVDEHHSAIEHMNDLNLWKLKQEHREKLASVQSKHIKEMDQIQQQAGLQREELEAEMEKIRDDKTCLRESLSLTVKERSRLEMELLDSTEKLVEAESQVRKLQSNLDNILKEKFGDLDPGSAEFFFQEERLRRLRSSYEEQCRELQDRIDELQAELQEYHNLGRTSQLCLKPSLSEELESKSPGMESDPGLGSEKGQPLFNMSLEAEIMLEQLKEKHLRDMEDLQAQLESKVSEFDQKVEEQKADLEAQKAALSLQYMEEIHALQAEMASSQNQALELKAWLEQAEEERAYLEQRQAGEREELENQQDEEVSGLKQELLEAHTQAADLEEQLKVLEEQLKGLEERHAVELNKLDEEHKEILLTRMEEERGKLQEARAEVERRLSAEVERRLSAEVERRLSAEVERRLSAEVERRLSAEVERRLSAEVERRLSAEVERRLSAEWERKKVELQQTHEETVKARIEDVRLMEEGERKKAQLDKQSNELLQTTLEEAMLRLVKEQEKEARLTEQWELERARLQQCHEAALLTRLAEGRLKQQEETERRLREDWDRERLQLEEDYEGMLQEQLQQERERLAGEKEEVEKRLEQMIEEEKERLKEAHRQAMQEVSAKHSEEREQISRLLDQLLEDIADKSLKLEHFRKEKISAQKKAESFKRQISALCLRGQQLEDENGLLSEKNAQNAAGVEGLSQQLGELLRQSERQETVRVQQRTVVPEDDRTKMAVCVSALEAELTSAVEGTVLLQQDKAQLLLQLNTLRDMTQLLEESLQSVNLQSARLKSDLRLSQQEKDALKQEVMTLHKQLQNGNDKNQVLEMALHSSRYQSQHRKLYRDELARLVEQEKLKQEIERLTIELHNAKGDHHHTREKDERAMMMMMMMKMEERMREIELSLHDVKLLLKEKVCQLKDQRHKNGKADLLIKDLYVENGQLLEALEMTEQRQKVAEKKNYLLEEKISSLNKIVRDLSPSPLPPMSYHLTRS